MRIYFLSFDFKIQHLGGRAVAVVLFAAHGLVAIARGGRRDLLPKLFAAYVFRVIADLPDALILQKQLIHDVSADARSAVGIGDEKFADRPIERLVAFRPLIDEYKACKFLVYIDKVGVSVLLGEVSFYARIAEEPRFVEGIAVILRKS